MSPATAAGAVRCSLHALSIADASVSPSSETTDDCRGQRAQLEPAHGVPGVPVGEQVHLATRRVSVARLVGRELVDRPPVAQEARRIDEDEGSIGRDLVRCRLLRPALGRGHGEVTRARARPDPPGTAGTRGSAAHRGCTHAKSSFGTSRR